MAATGISLAAVAPPLAFINLTVGLASINQADYYIPLVVGAVIWFVALLAYRHLVEAIPHAGGEYVFLSRIVSPVVGSAVGVGIAVVFTYTLASNARFFAAYTPFMLTGLGSALGSHPIAHAATLVTSRGAVAAISVGVVLIAGAASLASLRRLSRAIAGLIVLQLITLLVLALLLADHSRHDFIVALARYSHHSGAYAAVLSAAKGTGAVFGGSASGMIAAVPLMLLNYNGVLYSDYLGGELRRPTRTYTFASGISIGLLLITWVGLWALLRHAVGIDFMQAQASLASHHLRTYAGISGLIATAGGLGYGLVLSGDPVTKILLATGIPLTCVAVNLALLTVTTRVLYALASDRLLPIGVARLSDRTHTPTAAVGIVVAVSLFFCAILATVQIASVVALESLFFALILLAGGVAAACLAHRRPELIRRPGAHDVPRRARVPTVTWAGAATVSLAGFDLVEIVLHQAAYGNLSLQTVTTLAIVLSAGPLIYLVARQVRRRRSQIDLRLAMLELPGD